MCAFFMTSLFIGLVVELALLEPILESDLS